MTRVHASALVATWLRANVKCRRLRTIRRAPGELAGTEFAFLTQTQWTAAAVAVRAKAEPAAAGVTLPMLGAMPTRVLERTRG